MDLKNINKWRISRDYIKQLALHVNSWHHLEDRRFDFTLTFTDVAYKLELKLEFAMEQKRSKIATVIMFKAIPVELIVFVPFQRNKQAKWLK